MIALHARRSAESVERFHAANPGHRGLCVVLTGTDLYRDLPESAAAARSLDLADRIVVLQEDARRILAARWRTKAEVIYQSARFLAPARKPRDVLRCLAVGHLREEKDPRTLFAAMGLTPRSLPITLRHIGAPLDSRLAAAARGLQRRDDRFRYVGALPHGLARAAIKAAHVLVHPSRMEGGANVIVEAVTSGTAVLASRVSGNEGMLGSAYGGYFEPGDASGLARCLVRAVEERGYLRDLERQCAHRRALFNPKAESRALNALLSRLEV